MKLFLYIRIIDDPLDFNPEVLNGVNGYCNDVTTFDIDNFSDVTTAQTAIQGLQKASKAFIYVEVKAQKQPGQLLKIFMHLGKISAPFNILYKDEHPMISKILIRWEDRVNKKGELYELMANFFREGS